MKKSLCLLLIAVAFFACKKDENADNEKQIVRTWNVYKMDLLGNTTYNSDNVSCPLDLKADKTYSGNSLIFPGNPGNWKLLSDNTQLYLYNPTKSLTFEIIRLDDELHLMNVNNNEHIIYLK